MKKIGIITYHFANNYGAVLQCYALQTYLTQRGFKVTVFNFVSEKQAKNNDVIKHGKSVKSVIANICLLPFSHYIKGTKRFVRKILTSHLISQKSGIYKNILRIMDMTLLFQEVIKY